MTRVVDFGVSPDVILPSELNNIQDDYDQLYQNRFPILTGNMFNLATKYIAGTDWVLHPDGAETAYDRATNTMLNPDGSSLYYWDPQEWRTPSKGRALFWRLRSALVLGSTTVNPFNTAVTVTVRNMTSSWGGASGTTSVWATNWTSLNHTASATVARTDVLTSAPLAVPVTAGWYTLVLALGADPTDDALSALSAELSLLIPSS